MGLMALAPRAADPPLWFVFVLFPLVFFGGSLLSARLMGIFQLYRDFPADLTDPIEENLGWKQVEFGAFRGHTPMSIKLGKRCLHLKQPFPFQPAFWKGPASIPWGEVILEQEPNAAWWAFLSAAQFRLGRSGRKVRLRGGAAKGLMARVKEKQGGMAPGPLSPKGPGAIRPS